MISVEAAKQIIYKHTTPLPPVLIPLLQAAGLVLAEDVYTDQSFPHFRQSAMDGYAFKFSDLSTTTAFTIKGESAAGTNQQISMASTEAVRIFTGAPVPDGTDTVVMQEKTEVHGQTLFIKDKALQLGSNVRPIGSEIFAGTLALPNNTLLSPAAIGFLSGLGKTTVLAYPKPAVTIITTGKELQQPGQPLQYGQVYESNSFALQAALQQLHITNITCHWADDDLHLIKNLLQQALQQSNLILLTGGVSVGDYDFVAQALEQCGVEKLFHKIKQKPGKPLFVGKHNSTLIFGLPGNPSSVLTCFYEYVLPALQQLTNRKTPYLQTTYQPLATEYTKKEGLTHFLKGALGPEGAIPLTAQESYKMASFALAHCLIVLEEDKTYFKKGETVEVHLLPV